MPDGSKALFSETFSLITGKQDSVVIIVTRLWAGRSGVRIPAGETIYFSKKRPDYPRPTQLPIQWVPGGCFPKVKRAGREADHSPPFGAEVNNKWSYTSTLPICLNGMYRDNFTFSQFH
jgi:hypothetical protein